MQSEYLLFTWWLLLVDNNNVGEAIVQPHGVPKCEIELIVGHREPVPNDKHPLAARHSTVGLPERVGVPLLQRGVGMFRECWGKEDQLTKFLTSVTLDRVPRPLSI